MLIDSFGRKIDYIRLSVTDRCNLRCNYCMPENIVFAPKKELLSYEEMLFILETLQKNGFKKVRITGGEPLARKNLMFFLKELSTLGYDEITLTTNGVLINDYLEELIELGITRLNLSLDTLIKEKFNTITRKDDFDVVMQSLNRMLALNMIVKLNAVVMNGVNDDEIESLAELSLKHKMGVRFIEEMPFDGTSKSKSKRFLNYKEIISRLENRFPNLEKIEDPVASTALNYKIKGAQGTIGVIPAFSRTFCGTCNRIRISALGDLRTCLYENDGFSIRNVIRNYPGNETMLMKSITQAVRHKYKDGFEAEANEKLLIKNSMSIIGG